MKQGNGTKARKLNSAIIGVVFIIAGIVALGVQFAPLFADTAKPEPVNYHKACSEDPEPFDSYDNYMPRLVRLGVPAHTLVEVKQEIRSAMHDVHSSMADAHQALREVRRSLHEVRSEVRNSLHGVRRDIRDSLRSLPESLAGVFRSLKSAPEHDVEVTVEVRHQRTNRQQRPGSESL